MSIVTKLYKIDKGSEKEIKKILKRCLCEQVCVVVGTRTNVFWKDNHKIEDYSNNSK